MREPPTLVRDPIQRPDEPRHFMVLKPLRHQVAAARRGHELARTRDGLRMQEAGYDLYDPSVFFPRADVNMALLRPSTKTKHCPLKGDNQYYDLVLEDEVLENAAWSFVEVCHFDPRLEQLRERVAFDTSKIQVTEHTVVDELDTSG
jgi:uncharacterized protein (DUF427 family)